MENRTDIYNLWIQYTTKVNEDTSLFFPTPFCWHNRKLFRTFPLRPNANCFLIMFVFCFADALNGISHAFTTRWLPNTLQPTPIFVHVYHFFLASECKQWFDGAYSMLISAFIPLIAIAIGKWSASIRLVLKMRKAIHKCSKRRPKCTCQQVYAIIDNEEYDHSLMDNDEMWRPSHNVKWAAVCVRPVSANVWWMLSDNRMHDSLAVMKLNAVKRACVWNGVLETIFTSYAAIINFKCRCRPIHR